MTFDASHPGYRSLSDLVGTGMMLVLAERAYRNGTAPG
jgi:hypothetical protein